MYVNIVSCSLYKNIKFTRKNKKNLEKRKHKKIEIDLPKLRTILFKFK